ncbi:MAG: phenylalanine--tRNA ligase subunit alpha [Gemmatimonadaceae bacterium]
MPFTPPRVDVVVAPTQPPLLRVTDPLTPRELLEMFAHVASEGSAAFAAATTADAVEATRVRYIGDRSGQLRDLQTRMGTLIRDASPVDRAAMGKAFNAARDALESVLAERRIALGRPARADADIDLTMPARRSWRGAKHPVTIVIEEIEGIFRELGFTIALGPEAESEWYNFLSLNFPRDHPAMDMHDTLYLSGDVVLRTHTSPVQVRALQRMEPPVRILVPGNVYRRDFFDASHAPMFAQIEGLAIDEGISFVDLKATLSHFGARFFGAAKTRFRPSYFPFTEPSAEMDVQCQLCAGSGCPVCKQTGWTEILGCGMVHPTVLENAGLDAERYTGWAFGMGPARVALQRYGLPDIRLLYDSDVRFLRQFAP